MLRPPLNIFIGLGTPIFSLDEVLCRVEQDLDVL